MHQAPEEGGRHANEAKGSFGAGVGAATGLLRQGRRNQQAAQAQQQAQAQAQAGLNNYDRGPTPPVYKGVDTKCARASGKVVPPYVPRHAGAAAISGVSLYG